MSGFGIAIRGPGVGETVSPAELENTAVTPGSYTLTSLTVDADGRITAASNGTAGDASTNTASSVDGEAVLFSGAGGKTLKRATGTGIASLTSGVLSASTTPALGTPSSGVATNLTGTAAGLTAGTVTTNANLTGPITSVGNATSLAVAGLPRTRSILASVALAAQEAAIGATNLLTAPTAGMYIITFYQVITQAATTSSSTQVTFTWTDAAIAQSAVQAAIASNGLGALSRSTQIIMVASGDIAYSVAYSSSGATPMQYGLNIIVERVQ